jgi:4-hydroxybenzoate polyprenyltransferase
MKNFPYFLALRPRQWTKNLVVFAAILFAFKISWLSFWESFLAFVLFCAISSGFYLFNDIVDLESDRLHPVKCQRPIASGKVKIPVAMGMAIFLIFGAFLMGYLYKPLLGFILISYAIVQVCYNFRLKHMPILDIIAIASGFVLRALAGGAASSINLSVWFLLCTAMLALFLAIEKRKAELRLLAIGGGKTRAVLQRYSLPLLTRMESTVTTGVIMSYALWSSGPQVNGASTPWMMLTFPFVLYGVFRYQLLSDIRVKVGEEDKDAKTQRTERPEEILLSDRPILLTIVGWLLAIFLILLLQSQGIIP